MAAPLMRPLALALALLPMPAAAQALVDPTLPPASLRSAPNESAAPPAPKLQMILRGPDELQRALIDGRWLRVGDPLPGSTARVLSITDSAVVLARGSQTESLELLPTIATRAAAIDTEQEAQK